MSARPRRGNAPWFDRLLRFAAERGRADARDWARRELARNGGLTRDEVAARAVRQASVFAGALGSLSGMMNMVPGLGTALGMMASTPENVYITYRRLRIIVFVAAAHGRELEGEAFLDQMLFVLGMSAGIERAREIFAAWSRAKDLARFSEFLPVPERDRFLVEVPRRIVMTYGGVALLRRIPLVCLPLNVSLDYTLVSSTGLAARHFFDDLSYDDAELDELGVAAYRKQRAMLALMVAMARADGRLDESERALIDACRKVLVVPASLRKTAAADLLRVPDAAEMEELFDAEDRELVGRNLCRVMWADAHASSEERALLDRFRRVLGLDDETMARIESELAEEAAQGGGEARA